MDFSDYKRTCETWATASIEDRESVKVLHRAIRALPEGRYRNLAWGFVRGLPYRRIERSTRTQRLGDGAIVVHNKADIFKIHAALRASGLGMDCAAFGGDPTIRAWLDDPNGAIAAPPMKPKGPLQIPPLGDWIGVKVAE